MLSKFRRGALCNNEFCMTNSSDPHGYLCYFYVRALAFGDQKEMMKNNYLHVKGNNFFYSST